MKLHCCLYLFPTIIFPRTRAIEDPKEGCWTEDLEACCEASLLHVFPTIMGKEPKIEDPKDCRIEEACNPHATPKP